MARRATIDWKMAAGFGGLIFLIIAVGFVGISQIKSLAVAITRLAKTDMPVQSAVSDMKSANSQYAMAIRSYMFWRNAKYLDAAAMAGKGNSIASSVSRFDESLSAYKELIYGRQQPAWFEEIKNNESELRKSGDKIIALVNKMDSVSIDDKKSAEESLTRQFMEFENRLFQIDAFLNKPVQESNFKEIDRRLSLAEAERNRSLLLLYVSLCIGVLLGFQTAFLIYLRSRFETQRMEVLTRKIIRLEEEEKNRLSTQVHDQMGQDLSAIKIYLGLIERDLPVEAGESREKISKTKQVLDGLMKKAHNISELLRPPELDDLGLVDSIAALISRYEEMTQIKYVYSKPGEYLDLSSEHSLTLYRVIQEALTNIAKHSCAKNVSISLEKSQDSVRLSVCDDGIGFDYVSLIKQPSRRKEDKLKLGLHGLKERVELLGGKIDMISTPGHGTKFSVVFYI